MDFARGSDNHYYVADNTYEWDTNSLEFGCPCCGDDLSYVHRHTRAGREVKAHFRHEHSQGDCPFQKSNPQAYRSRRRHLIHLALTVRLFAEIIAEGSYEAALPFELPTGVSAEMLVRCNRELPAYTLYGGSGRAPDGGFDTFYVLYVHEMMYAEEWDVLLRNLRRLDENIATFFFFHNLRCAQRLLDLFYSAYQYRYNDETTEWEIIAHHKNTTERGMQLYRGCKARFNHLEADRIAAYHTQVWRGAPIVQLYEPEWWVDQTALSNVQLRKRHPHLWSSRTIFS